MITIIQKIKITPSEENIILTEGINYLKVIRRFKGCKSIELSQNIEDKHLFSFQSSWEMLDDATNFFKNGLNYHLAPDWNLQDYTIELECKAVNLSFKDELKPLNSKRESFITKLNKLDFSALSIRKRPHSKYASSHLSQDQIDEYLEVIENYMEKFEPYREKDLTLVKFAKMVGLHSHHVSRVINEKLNQNFSDFVNSFRVELAKKLLLQDFLERYTISGIGDEAGFNSRSAFYNAFKKFTGKSPGEFIEARRVDVWVA
jgi:AraC-like DNA-binding protein